MDQVVDQLVCRFCGKTAKSKSGLTNHEKICPKAGNREETTMKVPTNRCDHAEEPDDYDDDEARRPKQKNNPFQISGAFLVMADYVPVLLDVDFCIALGNYILEHGSSNSAIMAFAHQLNKLDGE